MRSDRRKKTALHALCLGAQELEGGVPAAVGTLAADLIAKGSTERGGAHLVLDAQDFNGSTSVMLAAGLRDALVRNAMCSLLMEAGVSLSLLSRRGGSAADVAASVGDADLAQFMIGRGAPDGGGKEGILEEEELTAGQLRKREEQEEVDAAERMAKAESGMKTRMFAAVEALMSQPCSEREAREASDKRVVKAMKSQYPSIKSKLVKEAIAAAKVQMALGPVFICVTGFKENTKDPSDVSAIVVQSDERGEPVPAHRAITQERLDALVSGGRATMPGVCMGSPTIAEKWSAFTARPGISMSFVVAVPAAPAPSPLTIQEKFDRIKAVSAKHNHSPFATATATATGFPCSEPSL